MAQVVLCAEDAVEFDCSGLAQGLLDLSNLTLQQSILKHQPPYNDGDNNFIDVYLSLYANITAREEHMYYDERMRTLLRGLLKVGDGLSGVIQQQLVRVVANVIRQLVSDTAFFPAV